MYYVTVCYFIVAGCIWFFFIGNPKEVGLVVESEVVDDDFVPTTESADEQRIDFLTAMKAPYVMLYGFSFFCVKFAVYAILLWMPMYLREDFQWENQHIANAMTVYEIGAAIGTVVLCMLSDRNDGARRSPTALASISVAFLISLTFWIFYNRYPKTLWLVAMFCFGFTLSSIHHMIVITAAADLGRRHNSRATSTITGIIDGVGSMGNGLGQVFLGGMVEAFGWRFGFLLPISLAIGFTFVPLVKLSLIHI